MSNHAMFLKTHHQKYQHLPQLRIDFHWDKRIESEAITLLMMRLLDRQYIKHYLFILNHSKDNDDYISALFYLEKFQYEALVIIAVESYWQSCTDGEGNIKEQEVTDSTITELEAIFERTKQKEGNQSPRCHYA